MLGAGRVGILEVSHVFGYQSHHQGTLDCASADGPAAIPGALPRVWVYVCEWGERLAKSRSPES